MNEADSRTDVLIVGAGMAGLAAARALAERGTKVLMIEARDRVGGRVFSQNVGSGVVVEHGAEFVHGRAPELWALIDESGVTAVERDGAMLREEPGSGLRQDDVEDQAMFPALEKLEDFQGEDAPFTQWLNGSDVPLEDRPALIGYVEGFNAADASRIGVRSLGVQQQAEEAIEGDRAWHITGGYAQLAEYLGARVRELGGEIRLGCAVRAVRWTRGEVSVETSAGNFDASRCIVTLPLGVLQRVNSADGLRIEPAPAALAAARRMAMGHVVRLTLVFRERWWTDAEVALNRDKLEAMSFLFTPQRMPPVWWTRHPESESLPTLTGWVGGPRSSALQGQSAEELGKVACAALARVFVMDEEVLWSKLVATHVHDWTADPFALGAYSYVPAGALDASAAMTLPQEDTLFFAGEHTDTTGHWGTVHAALRSGLRAAEQVLGEK